MLRSCRFDRFPKVCLLAMTLGVTAGCYVPGGGWTLRTGVDWRTHAKPGAYLELVDTRWDEWNRVAQMNAMMGEAYPVVSEPNAAPASSAPPAQTPPQEPYPVPPAAQTSAGESEYPRLESRRREGATRRFNQSQVAGRSSTRRMEIAELEDIPDPADQSSGRDDIVQSSWRAPGGRANRPVGSKSPPGKEPPGGWLFRGVRR